MTRRGPRLYWTSGAGFRDRMACGARAASGPALQSTILLEIPSDRDWQPSWPTSWANWVLRRISKVWVGTPPILTPCPTHWSGAGGPTPPWSFTTSTTPAPKRIPPATPPTPAKQRTAFWIRLWPAPAWRSPTPCGSRPRRRLPGTCPGCGW